MYAKASDIRKDLAEMIKAPNRMKVSEAASLYMRVPLGGGASIKWDKDRAPYIIEPMNCLNSREYDAVIFVGPARTGKTIGLIDGWITYSIVCDPSDFLLVQLTQEKASEHSRKRLDRMFRCSPDLAKCLSPRKNDNNVHDKYFRAGSEETLKAVTNTDWGLPYLPRSALEQRRSDELMERREEIDEKTVPPQCRFIVAAVDVQGGKNRRFVVQMVGYGENGDPHVSDPPVR